MNIPNLITLLRIMLVPVIVILLIQGSFFHALIVFIVASLSDALAWIFAPETTLLSSVHEHASHVRPSGSLYPETRTVVTAPHSVHLYS